MVRRVYLSVMETQVMDFFSAFSQGKEPLSRGVLDNCEIRRWNRSFGIVVPLQSHGNIKDRKMSEII